MSKDIKNCSIYTRKSTDEGLDQDFNSLHAQREACEAYIKSQVGKGWKTRSKKYNDGGYSGGTMERPALQELIDDIKAGHIDIVVVYKIDRLTRSLMDFSKLVDVFDQYNVTFVSVTQSFNTTTSIGRLTLNVLLSFAQFEREVTAERIRDKFKASKQKGMWMGGFVPIGYRVENRHLIVEEDHKVFVQNLFHKYLQFKSVGRLKDYLDQNNVTTPIRYSRNGKQHGGTLISRGALHAILCNPIYIGKIKHKDNVYEGLHDAIIDQETWDKVQQHLTNQSPTKRGLKKSSSSGLLKGKLFDENGSFYTPVYTSKKGKQYHYYVCKKQNRLNAKLSAPEIEKAVQASLKDALKNPDTLADIFGLPIHEYCDLLNIASKRLDEAKPKDLIKTCLDKIVLRNTQMELHIKPIELGELANIKSKRKDPFIVTSPFKTMRTTKGAIFVSNSDNKIDLPPDQLKQLVRGIVWRDDHFEGKTLREIAKETDFSLAYVAKCINKSFEISL